MCNLYTYGKNQAALRRIFKGLEDNAGNLDPGEIFPDYLAPVIRSRDGGHELLKMRWGFPPPPNGNARMVTNVRNVKSGYWRPWLEPAQRCLVPATSFCEYNDAPDPASKRKLRVWFGLSHEESIFFFAGIWRPWTGTRGTKKDPVEGEHLVYSFLTCEPNKVVKPVHAKAMPVILTDPEECEIWLRAPAEEALKLQRPLPDDALEIVLPPPGEE